MIISLTGFMGCGKSSVARELSSLLGRVLVDLDEYIEAARGRSIPEIFASSGEAAFRQMELSALREIVDGGGDTVLSLGGGTLTGQECARIVRERTFCVYLRARTATLVENLWGYSDGRPMLGETRTRQELQQRIEELMAGRERVYEAVSHAVVDVDGKSYRDVAAEICGLGGAYLR